VPATSYLRDVVELSPIAFILCSGGIAEFVRDKSIVAKRKKCFFRVTDDAIEFRDLWRTRRILWNDVESIIWDSDSGRNNASYMVAEISSGSEKIRISEQFFRNDQVTLAFGVSMLKTGGRTLSD
jgi:hypothetical protein